jgi:hypothetical protein
LPSPDAAGQLLKTRKNIMKKYLTVAAGLIAGATLMLAAGPGFAATVDVNVVVPGVVLQTQPIYMQPRPTYIHPQYEVDWRERQLRAIEWRDNPNNHGQAVSAAAHARNDVRKGSRGKHQNQGKNND